MDIKIAFFDIDGTLISKNNPEPSTATIEALNKMKDKGIQLFIATGRAPYTTPKFKNISFDGYLCFNGSYCFDSQHVIYSNPLDVHDVNTFIENAKALGHATACCNHERMGCNFQDDILDEYAGIAKALCPAVEDFDTLKNDHVIQMLVGATSSEDEALLKGTTHLKIARWWDKATDVISTDCGKAKAIEMILKDYHMTKDNAIAFGDGGNDLDMIQYVGTGVAMGNAVDLVKQNADYITDDVDHDGIASALKHFNIID